MNLIQKFLNEEVSDPMIKEKVNDKNIEKSEEEIETYESKEGLNSFLFFHRF